MAISHGECGVSLLFAIKSCSLGGHGLLWHLDLDSVTRTQFLLMVGESLLHVSPLFGAITHCAIQNFLKLTSFHGLKVCVFCFVYMYHVIEITYRVPHDLEKLADMLLVIDGDWLPLRCIAVKM